MITIVLHLCRVSAFYWRLSALRVYCPSCFIGSASSSSGNVLCYRIAEGKPGQFLTIQSTLALPGLNRLNYGNRKVLFKVALARDIKLSEVDPACFTSENIW